MNSWPRCSTGSMLNYSWWINRKDADGRDIFGGGFLGMDNIGVFDRDQPLPDGAPWSRATARAGWRSLV